jgi:hypothetical protein
MAKSKPSTKELKSLWHVVEGFIREQDIGSVETIYQCDRVIENAYEFIEKCCVVVGYDDFEEEYE